MPYWRLSGFYFFYFASLGALLPYWGPYLKERGFSPSEIGELMAIIMATKLVAPYIWGWIADHSGQRMPIVRLASLLSALVFAGIFWVSGYWSFALVMLLFSFFWNASLPQFEAVTMSYLGERIRRYSLIRLWGSIGFILAVVGLGMSVDEMGIGLVPAVVLAFYLGIWLNSLVVPEPQGAKQHHHQDSILQVLKRGEVIAFMLVCFLMQASHGAYYAFYSLFMEEHGYSSSAIGQLWALGVFAEVLVFLVMHRLLQRWDARLVLTATLIIAVVRWIMVGGAPENLILVLLSQIMHAATFGAFHAAAIHQIHHYFVGRHQGRGQALYSSVSFGAGGAIGSLLSGYLWSSVSPSSAFYLAAVYAALATLIAINWMGLNLSLFSKRARN
jgi:PPP family 3-phenylpropionic acid transporter